MNLLNDVFVIENLTVLNEAKDGKNMRIRGVFQRADEANNNKRIYPKKLLEREMARLAESISGRSLMGELDHPSYDNVKLANVSHIITNLKMNGNEMIGEAEILNTPAGQVAQRLIEGGVKVGISSRGMGTLTEGIGGVKHVNEDFKLVTFDLVADPSTRGAFPGLSESTEITSIIESTLEDVIPERVFFSILKKKLKEARRPSTTKVERQKANSDNAWRGENRNYANTKRKEAHKLGRGVKKGSLNFRDPRASKFTGTLGAAQERRKEAQKFSKMKRTERGGAEYVANRKDRAISIAKKKLKSFSAEKKARLPEETIEKLRKLKEGSLSLARAQRRPTTRAKIKNKHQGLNTKTDNSNMAWEQRVKRGQYGTGKRNNTTKRFPPSRKFGAVVTGGKHGRTNFGGEKAPWELRDLKIRLKNRARKKQ